MGVPKGEWPLSLLQPSEESDHAKLMKDIGEEVEKRIERVIYRTLIWPAVAVALIYGLIKSCNSN